MTKNLQPVAAMALGNRVSLGRARPLALPRWRERTLPDRPPGVV
jgi:hypothetical protein